jgi:RNA polymerase-binding transcription factor DksA
MNLNVARRRLEEEWQWLLVARDAIDAEELSAQSEDESVSELSPIDQHQADAGSETFEREKDFSIRDQVDRDLVAVQQAFVRIDQGTYGRCETCRAPIPDERLDAVPTARFCFDHERAWELRTLTMPVPDVVWSGEASSAELIAEREATTHLEYLPSDDEMEPELELPAEEAAMHEVESSW